MLLFYLETARETADGTADRRRSPSVERLTACVEATLRDQLGSRFREEDLLARGGPGEWFVFLASPPRSRQGVTRRDLQEVERRVARELRARMRETLPRVPGGELPPLRSGAAVLARDPTVSVAVQLQAARNEARLHGRISMLLDDQLSGLNHKIRTPLTTIKGVIEILRHDPEAAGRFLGPLEHEVERIQRLLKQFSLVTRLQSGLFDPVLQDIDLRELVAAVVAGLSGLATDYHVTVVVHMPRRPLPVVGAVEILDEAVRQLIDNAIRHGARGQLVQVTVRSARPWAEVEITDHGPGIPREDMPNLFQPFYVVGRDPDVRSQGGGLGLCLARGIVDLLGGELDCASTPGQGTTVRLRLARVVPHLASEARLKSRAGETLEGAAQQASRSEGGGSAAPAGGSAASPTVLLKRPKSRAGERHEG